MLRLRPLSKSPNPQLLPGGRSIVFPLLRVCVHSMCVFVHFSLLCVCVHVGGLNAEQKFQVWDTILGHTSRPFLSTNILFYTKVLKKIK